MSAFIPSKNICIFILTCRKLKSENLGITFKPSHSEIQYYSVFPFDSLQPIPSRQPHQLRTQFYAGSVQKQANQESQEDQGLFEYRFSVKDHFHQSKVHFPDIEVSYLSKELRHSYESLHGFFQQKNHQQIHEKLILQNNLNEYYEWLNQIKDKCLIVWYVPFCEKGMKLRSFSISSSFIKLLDYKIDDLALDIQHFGAQAIDVIDGQVYKTCFFLIINVCKKLQQLKNHGGITKQQILKQSQTVIVNEIKGKGNKKLTVQTKISFASQCLITFQILRVLDKKQVKDHQRKICRESAIQQAQKVAFNCLSRVARLPKSINPQNSAKICSYIQIRPQKSHKQSKKMMNM